MGTSRITALEVTNNTKTNTLTTPSINSATGDVAFSDDIDMDTGEYVYTDNLYTDFIYSRNTNNLFLNGSVHLVVVGTNPRTGATDDLWVDGDFDTTGQKLCVLKGLDGKGYAYACVESPEIWFVENFSSSLINGKKEIKLDKRFIATTTINELNPMKVNVTPNGDCKGLWVEKFYDKIIVHELNNGKSNIPFDVTISAKKLGCENIRFDEFIKDEKSGEYYKRTKKELYYEKLPVQIEIKKISDEIKVNKDNIIEINKSIKDFKGKIGQEYIVEDLEKTLKDKIILINDKMKLYKEKYDKIKEIEKKHRYKYSWMPNNK